ncbi:MAG: MoaD/ThiS family protein [Proteobacteria bacterium]|nr:MoaD/ThiS family protein [Pseudomonadota bacterium]
MKVEIGLFATFAKYLPEEAEGFKVTIELDEGSTVKDVLLRMGVPLDEIKLIFINSVKADVEDVLKDGDKMGAFPPVAGG